jgi:hypothetical protein
VAIAPVPRPPAVRSLGLPGVMDAAPAVVLPAVNADDVSRSVEESDPPVIGRVYDVQATSANCGTWSDLAAGGRLWTVSVKSPDAQAVRLRLDDFNPPSGCELVVYNLDDPQEAYGPFRRGSVRPGFPLWTPTVFGAQVGVEFYVPPSVGGNTPNLTITGAAEQFSTTGNDDPIGCRIDVTCYPEWTVTSHAVAHIRFLSGGSWYICSGAMITRYWGDDFSRQFMTASHCINDEAAANTMEAYWFFQTADCNGVPPDLSTCPRSVGAVYMRSDLVADITILGITGDVPAGLTWAGWDASAAPDPTPATVIHHPDGVRKSISWGQLEGLPWFVFCPLGSPIDDAYALQFADGGQEGGSSGGPVFDTANHRIRAVVSCSEEGCSPTEQAWEGALCRAYDELWTVMEGWDHVWVDGGYTGTELGNYTFPWKTITKGSFAVMAPGTVHIKAGNYPAMTFPVAPGDGRVITYQAENGTVVIGQ